MLNISSKKGTLTPLKNTRIHLSVEGAKGRVRKKLPIKLLGLMSRKNIKSKVTDG